MHNGISLQTLTITALLALVTLFVLFPVLLHTTTFGTNHASLFTILLEFGLITRLVRKFACEI
jgi:hypothetical protein